MEKTTLWVTKELRNELMKLKFDTSNGTIEEMISEMLKVYRNSEIYKYSMEYKEEA